MDEIEISDSLINDLAAMLYSEMFDVIQGDVQNEKKVIQKP